MFFVLQFDFRSDKTREFLRALRTEIKQNETSFGVILDTVCPTHMLFVLQFDFRSDLPREFLRALKMEIKQNKTSVWKS